MMNWTQIIMFSIFLASNKTSQSNGEFIRKGHDRSEEKNDRGNNDDVLDDRFQVRRRAEQGGKISAMKDMRTEIRRWKKSLDESGRGISGIRCSDGRNRCWKEIQKQEEKIENTFVMPIDQKQKLICAAIEKEEEEAPESTKEDEKEEEKTTEDFKYAVGVLQEEPIQINEFITFIGTATARAHASENVIAYLPPNIENGDMVFVFIGGSASGRKRPSDPSGNGWNKAIEFGPNDVNMKVFYKEYIGEEDQFKVSDGKNTYVTVLAMRGVNTENPIVSVNATRNSMDEKCGDALAPVVKTSKYGALIVSYLYDDPHMAYSTDESVREVCSIQSGDDGIMTGIASTDGKDHGPVHAVSCECRRGGGHSVEVSLSVRKA
mmetsp:Transcript_5027/g.10575  ORF Transcript_5027/g.10575 Transcript_5027/m.10575 type:complete len:377 (-) Transcript_5027:10-1140(-)